MMRTSTQLLSVELLRAVASNATNPAYPRHRLLRETQLALHLSIPDMAFLLGVRQQDLESWLSSEHSDAVPLYVTRDLHWILREAEKAAQCMKRPYWAAVFPEESMTLGSPRLFDAEPPAWHEIGVDLTTL